MSLNQRRRVRVASHREAVCRQTWLHPTQNLNVLSANPTCWERVTDEVSACVEEKTDEQLRQTQAELQRYRLLYDNIPSIYLSLDVTGTILSINELGANSLGYTPEQLIRQPIFQLFAQSEQQKLVNELLFLLTNKPKNDVNCGNLQLDCPLSSIKWVKVILRLIIDDYQNPLILMTCADVPTVVDVGDSSLSPTVNALKGQPTELDGAVCEDEEETLSTTTAAAYQEKLDSLNHLHEEFISTVSHELRTPLTNMKMAIQMLGVALDKEHKSFDNKENSKVSCYFDILNNECDRQINLINNFLDLKRIETNSQPWVLETIHIQQWLWQVVAKFQQHHVDLCQHNFRINIPASLPPLLCDSCTLERIITELLTNACKFSPPDAAIILEVTTQADKMIFKVTNFAVEIPQTELQRIFDKFYRIPSNDPAKQGGTGLGLALVQKLIQQLGGTITVESGSNRTCFTIQLNIGNRE